MNLYILRHASAGVRRADPVIDVKRPLDKEGKEQCLLIGRYLNALRVQFDLVISSPLKRALQTASLVGTEVAYDSKIQISDVLSPSGTVAGFQSLVTTLSAYENVLVVGHNPNLPEFLGALEHAHAQGCDCARRLYPPAGTTGFSAGRSDVAADLRQCGKKLAPENFAKVIAFLAQRPEL
jgi:phosphohistidine phosphatase SixA